MRKFVFVTMRDELNPASVECMVREKDREKFIEFFQKERKEGTFFVQLFDQGDNWGRQRTGEQV